MEFVEKKGAIKTEVTIAQEDGAVSVGHASAEEAFQPKGAFAFFALLVILGLIIWFGIYFLMLSRI